MPRTRSIAWSELKLGIVGIFAAALTVLIIVAVSGQGGFFWQRYPLKAQFPNAQGLKSGALVRLSGKDVGRITSVEFSGANIEVGFDVSKSVRQLIDMAKARPGAINFGSGGVGTTPHMAAQLFLLSAGLRMTHVSYRGEAPAIADVVGGQLPLLFANVSVATPQVKSGALRALAVTSPQRAPSLPDVPTLAEQGVKGSDTETGSASLRPRRRRAISCSSSMPRCAACWRRPNCGAASPSSASRSIPPRPRSWTPS
jgi:hypothetical protein